MVKSISWCRASLAAMLLFGGSSAAQEPPQAADPQTGKLLKYATDVLDPNGKANANQYPSAMAAYVGAQYFNEDLLSSLASYLGNPADDLLGASLSPVGDTLRTQLAIPAGRGLLVTNLRNDGPSAQAGLKANDILLTLADKPLGSAEDLSKHLKAAGDKAVALKILRGGKPVTLSVQPVYHVTLGSPAEVRKTYFIGVTIESLDDAVRSQLGLSGGVVVSEVVKDSPAEKAGVQAHDIIVELAGKTIDTTEKLTAQVQANMDKATTLKVVRGGKPLSIPIAGALRPQEPTADKPQATKLRYLLADGRTQDRYFYGMLKRDEASAAAERATALLTLKTEADEVNRLGQRLKEFEKQIREVRRVEELEKELAVLRDAVERLEAERKAAKGKK